VASQSGTGAATLTFMGYRDELDSDVRRLLNELCIELGFCLAPGDIRRLCESPPGDVGSFTGAVFEAEGMGDMSYTDLRRQVRHVVDQHMSRWLEADDEPTR
jgi:hypothetical protein